MGRSRYRLQESPDCQNEIRTHCMVADGPDAVERQVQYQIERKRRAISGRNHLAQDDQPIRFQRCTLTFAPSAFARGSPQMTGADKS